MDTTRPDAFTDDGRRVAVWRTAPATGDGPVVVVAPGFTKTMGDLSTVALYLAANGATVYRFDLVDHHGHSDGEILDFTMAAARRSAEAVLDLVAAVEGDDRPVHLVALSLSGRAALRAAAGRRLAGVVTVVGVVHLRATLGAAFGRHLVDAPIETLPATVAYGESVVRTEPMVLEDRRDDWWSFESTRHDLAALDAPLLAIHASGDPLVDAADVRAALAEPAAGRFTRRAVTVETDVHDLGEDVPAALRALAHVARAVCGPDARIPDLDEVVDALVAEQAWIAAGTPVLATAGAR